ncbi:MAG: PDZ domain-containing protein [Lachnospiraceae bacterium]|nr:PDZ domain-containing protein [Lachnospiraceae bacterium]
MEEEIKQEQASFDPAPDTAFVREKIKQKPINRRKLLRRTLFTVLAAVVFAVVACVTFLLLEPFISERLNSGKEVQTEPAVSVVDFSESTEDEMLPEDMYATDKEMISEALQGNVSEVNQNIRDIEEMISGIEFGLEDYQKLYGDLRSLAEEVSNSLVTVKGVTEETDLLNNPYENSDQVSGVIIADNGPSLLILVKDAGLTDADEMWVRFVDGTGARCTLMGRDDATEMLVLGVSKSSLSDSTRALAVPASLGTSRSTTLKGTPVIALGSPIGIADSFAYGMVTSGAQQLYMTDADYTLITTDILGTESSSGVLVSLRGNVIGIIDNSYESDAAGNVVNAIGITELKPLIEDLSNGEDRAYLGIKAMDITYELEAEYGLPDGFYIRYIEIDSPAMNAGLQNGDILVSVNGEKFNTYHDFILWLAKEAPDTTVTVSLMRPSVDRYVPIEAEVTLGSISYIPEDE